MHITMHTTNHLEENISTPTTTTTTPAHLAADATDPKYICLYVLPWESIVGVHPSVHKAVESAHDGPHGVSRRHLELEPNKITTKTRTRWQTVDVLRRGVTKEH